MPTAVLRREVESKSQGGGQPIQAAEMPEEMPAIQLEAASWLQGSDFPSHLSRTSKRKEERIQAKRRTE